MHEVDMRVSTARNRFLHYPESEIEDVRPIILESWRRSREFGVNAQAGTGAALSRADLEQAIEENGPLCEAAVPVMESLLDFVKDSCFFVTLSDRHGIVLKAFGDDDVMKVAAADMFVEGADRSEAALGTNAIGTAIANRQPLQVWADERYFKPDNAWTCSAAPIFDPSGELAGVLCLSGSWEKVHFHTLGMVVSACESVTRQLKYRGILTRTNDMRRKLDKAVELLDHGLLFTDMDGRITQLNALAASLLNISDVPWESVVGSRIARYFPGGGFDLADLLRSAGEEREIGIDTFVGTLHCSAALLPAACGDSGKREVAITLRKAEHVHRLVNRVVDMGARFSWEDIIGQSTALLEAKRAARVAAPHRGNVLLIGESGVGKTLFAHAIHSASDRADAPFVAVNCAAMPRSLIEAELFGCEGGTAAGADRGARAGKLELAAGGTIFLGGVGDMPRDVQARLSRALRSREAVRVGGGRPFHIDVRVVAANPGSLDERVASDTFSRDLYACFDARAVMVPPLRERNGDIRILCERMLRKVAADFDRSAVGFTEEAYQILESRSWPGNVRELENAVERAVLACGGSLISPADLPPAGTLSAASAPEYPAHPVVVTASKSEENLIRMAMKIHRGNIRKISRELCLSRSTLYRKLKKYDIDIKTVRA